MGVVCCSLGTQASANDSGEKQPLAQHQFGLCLSSVMFTKDLKEIFANTLSPSLSYRHKVGDKSWLGMRLASYFSKKDGFGNHVYELTPHLSSALHDEALSPFGPFIHGVVGVTIGYWRQFGTFDQELLLHEDLFFDWNMGLEFVFRSQASSALQLNTILAFREFRLTSAYYRVELMYTYSL